MNLAPLVIIAIAAILIIILGIKTYKQAKGPAVSSNRLIKKKFLTNNEKHFFGVLKAACANNFLICPQVSLGALVDLESAGLSTDEYWDAKKKFAMKIIDYVLCDPVSLEPVLIVELDDKSHSLKKDINRDAYTSHIGLKTLRLWSQQKPTATELKALIDAKLKGLP